ncbi:MAG: hypothetical protein KA773_20925, partial [Chloroflexi bacterium]|nr:hypothetical protein [Chloroflexota bacterium]
IKSRAESSETLNFMLLCNERGIITHIKNCSSLLCPFRFNGIMTGAVIARLMIFYGVMVGS